VKSIASISAPPSGMHHETGGMEHSMPLPPLFAHGWNRFFRVREETFMVECFCIPMRLTASVNPNCLL